MIILSHVYVELPTFIGPPTNAGRVLRTIVCPSFPQSNSFLRIGSLVSSETQCGVRCGFMHDRARFYGKKIFAKKIRKVIQERAWNRVFLSLLKNLVINFYWIGSLTKNDFICCVPIQILYLEKKFSLRCGPKCSQPIRLHYFKSFISLKSWCKFIKIKTWSKVFGVGQVKNGCDQFGHRTLKVTVYQEIADGIN